MLLLLIVGAFVVVIITPSSATSSNDDGEEGDRGVVLEDTSVKFLLFGDWGCGNTYARNSARGAASVARTLHPDFIISLGDNFYQVL